MTVGDLATREITRYRRDYGFTGKRRREMWIPFDMGNWQ